MLSCVQAQLRQLQQVAEDLQIKLDEHRRRKNEAERLKEQTLKAQQKGDSGESNLTLHKTFYEMSTVSPILLGHHHCSHGAILISFLRSRN